MRTQVGIVGAGPAGLTLAQLLWAEGIESVVLESRSRDYVEHRLRAGVLEQGTVDTLAGAGAGERLGREGIVHHGIGFQFDGERHRIPISDLTGGASIVVYGQTEIVKDLIRAPSRRGRAAALRGGRRRRARHRRRPAPDHLRARRPRAGAGVRPRRGLRRLLRRLPRDDPRGRPARVLARVPVRLAGDPGRRGAVTRRGALLQQRARVRAPQPALARDQPPLPPVPARRGSERVARRADLGRARRPARRSRAGRSIAGRYSRRASPGCGASWSSRCATATSSWPATLPTSSRPPARRA